VVLIVVVQGTFFLPDTPALFRKMGSQFVERNAVDHRIANRRW